MSQAHILIFYKLGYLDIRMKIKNIWKMLEAVRGKYYKSANDRDV